MLGKLGLLSFVDLLHDGAELAPKTPVREGEVTRF